MRSESGLRAIFAFIGILQMVLAIWSFVAKRPTSNRLDFWLVLARVAFGTFLAVFLLSGMKLIAWMVNLMVYTTIGLVLQGVWVEWRFRRHKQFLSEALHIRPETKDLV